MTTPRVPPAGAPAAPSTGAAGLVTVSSEIIRLPQELAARLLRAPRTVFLTGTVTGQTPDGALQLRSQFGEITVRASTPVPVDRQVSLQIPPLSGKAADLAPAQLARNPIPVSLLLSRPAAASAGTAQPGAGSGQATVAGQPQAPSPAQFGPASGQPQSAPPIAPRAPAPAAAPPVLQPGPVAATPGNVAAPQGAAQPNQPAPAATAAAQARAAAPGQAATPTTPNSQSAPNTTTTAAAGQPPTAAPQLGRPALSAQVVTQTATGAPGAGTPASPPAGGAAVPPPQGGPAPPAAAGAQAAASTAAAPPASVESGRMAVAAKPTPPPLVGDAGEPVLPAESARRVPVLREAVAALSVADPALATQFVRSMVPQGNAQLAATLLFFLSATRGGDIRGWVGDRVAARLDDAGRTDLMPRLSAELAAPTRPAAEQAATEWRSQAIPLYQDGDIGGLRLHVRSAGDEDGTPGDAEGRGSRFLIEMDLSRMGPLQLDGLVRNKRLDLTIRSRAAFPEAMRQDMRTLFRDASETVGLHGGLSFQAGGHDWVSIAPGHGAGRS